MIAGRLWPRMRSLRRLAQRSAGVFGVWACLVPAANAGIFDDDEARRAILDLRQKLEQSSEAQRSQQAELNAQRVKQAELNAQMLEQVTLLKRSLLELNNQLELLRADVAKQSGQDEQLARALAEQQLKLTALGQSLEDRLRKVEPLKIMLDGKEFDATSDEKRAHDNALAQLRAGDFNGSANALTAFLRRFQGSGYETAVLFWLGNAQYGKRDYKEAMASFRAVVTNAPEHPRAPESLLSLANCQFELKDAKGARKTLEELLKTYPKSEAAQAGKERLAALR